MRRREEEENIDDFIGLGTFGVFEENIRYIDHFLGCSPTKV